MPWKALILLSSKQRGRTRDFNACLHLPVSKHCLYSQSVIGLPVSFFRSPFSFLNHSYSIFKNLPALRSILSIIVGPQLLVTKRDARLTPQRTSVEKKSQELGRSEATPPNGNTAGCTQHSLLSVGLSLNQLTDQWMQTADQTTQGKQRYVQSPEYISYCAGWELLRSPIKLLLFSLVLW